MERECTLFKLESKVIIDKWLINSYMRDLKMLKTKILNWFSHRFCAFNYSLLVYQSW